MVAYQKIIKERGLIQSMSRKGNCLNNTVMENWLGILKTKLFYGKRFEDLQAFKQELKAYIDCYNHQWIKQKLKGLSPGQYRTQSFLVPQLNWPTLVDQFKRLKLNQT